MNQHLNAGHLLKKKFSLFFYYNNKAVAIVCSYLLAALFFYAAYNKLSTHNIFLIQLSESPITKGIENFLAWAVPGVEIIVACALVIPKTRLIGLYSSFFLMLGFTIYVYLLLHYFRVRTCSCGGIISKLSWIQHFYFNLAFTLLAVIGACLLPKKPGKTLR